ncbi:MAG: type II secretion system protein [Magnetococcales bacterium]|nr:type II secretion system protein [Magnetococcales bacterium]MBF0150084.1 type II secretion system protein [Magnetococcales bacterium]
MQSERRRGWGFTLVEVMVGMVLTGILLTGVVGLWGMVADQFFRLSLRQKAVFVLHGHMERLAQLYRYGNTTTNMSVYSSTTGYDHPPLATNTAHHILYVDETVRNSDDLMRTAAATKSAFEEGKILYMDYGAVNESAEDRNIVWLDREKDVAAQLSWYLDNTIDAGNQCYNDVQDVAGCRLLTLYLDYPYRFMAGTPPTMTALPEYTVETISIKTIVGRRKD